MPDWYVAKGVTPWLVSYWGEYYNAMCERALWMVVLKAQINAGVPTPVGALTAYLHTQHIYNPEWVEARERVTRHDIKARIEHWNDLAGFEVIHRGLTSHDVVDNVNLRKIQKSLYKLAGSWARPRLAEAADRMKMRGLRGPVGTAQDLTDLMGVEGLLLVEKRLRQEFEFYSQYESIGQIYPRSADLDWIDPLISDLITIGAPHRTQWFAAANGYADMLRSIADDQWNEGDVSGSVVRRVALPGLLFSADHAYRELDTQATNVV